MGKKTKNKKINKNLIPATTDSAVLNNILFEFEAHISKLEGQLREIEAQREAEIAAALESGRKEGHIKGCQERLEAVRQAVDVTGADTSRQLPATFTTNPVTGSITILPSASASYILHEISAF
jgi:flagellar biosynthesis/type III secretory pathway protein FliH